MTTIALDPEDDRLLSRAARERGIALGQISTVTLESMAGRRFSGKVVEIRASTTSA